MGYMKPARSVAGDERARGRTVDLALPWRKRIERAVEDPSSPSAEADAAVRSLAPVRARTGMVLMTISIVYVMVVKPQLF